MQADTTLKLNIYMRIFFSYNIILVAYKTFFLRNKKY